MQAARNSHLVPNTAKPMLNLSRLDTPEIERMSIKQEGIRLALTAFTNLHSDSFFSQLLGSIEQPIGCIDAHLVVTFRSVSY